MNSTIIKNPFVDCTARDMKSKEVSQYWCDSFTLYNLDKNELFTSKTPIIIEGARGTGKTMILKYLSYQVQKDINNLTKKEDILSRIGEFGLGIYFRYKDDFCNMFDYLDIDREGKKIIFKGYYQLFLLRELLMILDDIYHDDFKEEHKEVLKAFLGNNGDSFLSYREYVNSIIMELDNSLNTYAYGEDRDQPVRIAVMYQNVFVQIVKKINENWNGWKDVYFIILLDEYENARSFQTIINTYIKKTDDTLQLTYRIGMRPGGMDINNATNIAGEKLQPDRDFLIRQLKFDNRNVYKSFAKEVAKKRLQNVEIYQENGITDIEYILGKTENLDEEAKRIVTGDRQFEMLKDSVSEKDIPEAKKELSSDEKLLEMYNILCVSRGEKDFHEVGRISREFVKLRDEKKLKEADTDVKKYKLDYSDKYRMSLLYVLLAIYKQKKKEYYSFNTFLYLSSGSINDFISLCRNTFRFINIDDVQGLVQGRRISNYIQTKGAEITAYDQLRKLGMSQNYGIEMKTFVENLGELFREYHRDLKVRYPETNQFAFENEASVYNDNDLSAYLRELINTGAVILYKKQKISIGRHRGNIYQLNRIFAPIYQFSYRTRGGYNHILSKDDFYYMLHGNVDPKRLMIHDNLRQETLPF